MGYTQYVNASYCVLSIETVSSVAIQVVSELAMGQSLDARAISCSHADSTSCEAHRADSVSICIECDEKARLQGISLGINLESTWRAWRDDRNKAAGDAALVADTTGEEVS